MSAKVHGESKPPTTEYRAWKAMRDRCRDPEHQSAQYYAARGIQVDGRWATYENFLGDMGRKPTPKHSIDRIDNDKGYGPDNCRWATPEEQSRNRSSVRKITIDGKTATVREWCAVYGVNPGAAMARIYRGMSPEAAVSTPMRRKA